MNECCDTCKNKKDLIKLDCSQDGGITPYDGFACLALASEGEVDHMVGLDSSTGMCEMYAPKKRTGRCSSCINFLNNHLCLHWSKHGTIEVQSTDYCSYYDCLSPDEQDE